MPIATTPSGVVRFKALSAALTRAVKRMNHQNSERVARPPNSAYLRNTVVTAVPNDIEGPLVV